MRILAAGLVLALARCGGTSPVPTGAGPAEPVAYLAQAAEEVTVRVEPVSGAPAELGAEIAQEVATRLGPSPDPADRARRTLALVGRVEPAQISGDLLAVDWAVTDEEGSVIGSFTSSAPLTPATQAYGWERAGASTVEGVAAGAEQRFMRLPPVKATLQGRPGF